MYTRLGTPNATVAEELGSHLIRQVHILIQVQNSLAVYLKIKSFQLTSPFHMYSVAMCGCTAVDGDMNSCEKLSLVMVYVTKHYYITASDVQQSATSKDTK